MKSQSSHVQGYKSMSASSVCLHVSTAFGTVSSTGLFHLPLQSSPPFKKTVGLCALYRARHLTPLSVRMLRPKAQKHLNGADCSSGDRAGCPLSTGWAIRSSTLLLSTDYSEVSFGKTVSPKLLLMARPLHCMVPCKNFVSRVRFGCST